MNISWLKKINNKNHLNSIENLNQMKKINLGQLQGWFTQAISYERAPFDLFTCSGQAQLQVAITSMSK